MPVSVGRATETVDLSVSGTICCMTATEFPPPDGEQITRSAACRGKVEVLTAEARGNRILPIPADRCGRAGPWPHPRTMGGLPRYAVDRYSEAAVKAAYLYRFASYVDWPERHPPAEPFIIAVLGSPAVARELNGLLPDHHVDGRPVEVREVAGVRDLRPTRRYLFVGAGHADALRVIMPAVGREPMLLVTDEDDGLNQGSVLNFVTR